MKYTKYIIFFFIINLILVFLSIFVGSLTRKIELTNNVITQDIEKYTEQLIINKIEFSFYNNSNYLKKLHDIYFSFEEESLEKKVVSFSNIYRVTDNSLVFVNLRSK